MLIRIRSKDGNFRFKVEPTDDVSVLLNQILATTSNADPLSMTISNQPRGNEVVCTTIQGKTIQQLGFNHGDLLFIGYKEAQQAAESGSEPPSKTGAASSSTPDATKKPWETVTEDAVDTYWRHHSGMIPRSRDTTFCKHGANGMCDYCMPLEPYDVAYHKEHAIKHLSFHAYVKKLTPKSSNSSTASLPPLDPPSFRVKTPCPTGAHAPWPEGICSTCQPSAITLQPQQFRMVDHLEISSENIIERFLHSWRRTGVQRFGWLIGHYQPYEKVPMGLKAVVEAIYEPPQEGEIDGLTLGLPWEDEQRIRDLASTASQPLGIVGYIFTDLQPDEDDRTKSVYRRHPGSFSLSSLEAIFAATLQQKNSTPTRSSYSGTFSSRFVTACLTANKEGNVDILTFQVSQQAEAMVDADMIEASVDPGIVRVKEEDRSATSARYVPDVFFTYKNEYGLEVKKSAKPAFPVEYLLVNVTNGFPQNPSPLFHSIEFPIENRPGLEDQSIERVISSLQSLDATSIRESSSSGTGDLKKKMDLAKFLSDFHLITFLPTTGLYSLADTLTLLKAVSSPTLLDDPALLDPVLKCDSWQTLLTFAREMAPQRPTTSAPTLGGGTSAMDEDISQDVFDQIAADEAASRGTNIRLCPHCTFENTHSGTDCEVCGLPLQ
ncbi:NPL4 family-domain-containing protein [Flagelloscypha sp. PMI_526]|nr:NPL4 family-domain-containing protein [Flagelloscypha sp. PMI_526]